MEIIETKLHENSISEILRLDKLCFQKPTLKKVLLSRLSNKNYWIFFASEDKENIGFLVGYLDGLSSYCWLLGVSPGFRKKGTGLALLKKHEDFSKERGFNKITVKTHSKLAKMINLLNNHGYTETRREPNHWGDERTAVFFEKVIVNG